MTPQSILVRSSIAVTVILVVASSGAGVNWAWGINHLHFLPVTYTYLYWGLSVAAILILFNRRSQSTYSVLSGTSDILFESGPIVRAILAVASGIAFYFLRVNTYFLGDGYTWLGNFGSELGYFHKWTEYGSILLVRQMQTWLGGYTEQTALLTFRILSIGSGIVVVYNFVSIVRRLVEDKVLRILALAACLFSGHLLLYFGYVEFYPLLWAGGSTVINLSLKYAQERRTAVLAAALICYGIVLLIHLQAVWMVPGMLWLVVPTSAGWVRRRKLRILLKWCLAGLAVAATGIYVWLYQNVIEFNQIVLPVFEGKPQSPGYAMFSLRHFLDLINFILIMFPGIITIVILAAFAKLQSRTDKTRQFLLLLSVGSLVFWFAVDPRLGVSRDWDLMSFAALPPLLWLLHRIGSAGIRISGRLVLSWAIVTVSTTVMYLAVNISVEASEERFVSLLQFNQDKERQGWIVLANYWGQHGDTTKFRSAREEMDRLFPNYVLLRKGWDHFNSGDYKEAARIAQHLVKVDSTEPDFLQLLGDVYSRVGRFREAEKCYRTALRAKKDYPPILFGLGDLYLKQGRNVEALEILQSAREFAPEEVHILENIGLAHYNLGQLDAALAVVDSLFISNKNAAGGHLLKLMIAVKMNKRAAARYHFEEYAEHGKGRPEYQSIVDAYGFVLDQP